MEDVYAEKKKISLFRLEKCKTGIVLLNKFRDFSILCYDKQSGMLIWYY